MAQPMKCCFFAIAIPPSSSGRGAAVQAGTAKPLLYDTAEEKGIAQEVPPP
jgi:hypothetical protein